MSGRGFFVWLGFFKGAGHSLTEGKSDTFCGTDLICSHHCKDPRCVAANLIPLLLLHASGSSWDGLSFAASFMTPHADKP